MEKFEKGQHRENGESPLPLLWTSAFLGFLVFERAKHVKWAWALGCFFPPGGMTKARGGVLKPAPQLANRPAAWGPVSICRRVQYLNRAVDCSPREQPSAPVLDSRQRFQPVFGNKNPGGLAAHYDWRWRPQVNRQQKPTLPALGSQV